MGEPAEVRDAFADELLHDERGRAVFRFQSTPGFCYVRPSDVGVILGDLHGRAA